MVHIHTSVSFTTYVWYEPFLSDTDIEEFKKSTNICQSYSKNKSGPVFLDSQCRSVYHQKIPLLSHVFKETNVVI